MKKIIYSSVLKVIALLLLIAGLVAGTLTAVGGLIRYDREDMILYQFEQDFSEAWYPAYLVSIPESILHDAYYKIPGEEESTEEEIDTEGSGTPAPEPSGEETEAETEASPDLILNRERIGENLITLFGKVPDSDKIRYFVQWNDLVFTNCGAESAESLTQGSYYSYVKRDSGGSVSRQ